jgi:transcriptional regulator NrdR family protein
MLGTYRACGSRVTSPLLNALDEVAYLHFASVYKDERPADEFAGADTEDVKDLAAPANARGHDRKL